MLWEWWLLFLPLARIKLWVSLRRKVCTQMASGSAPYIKTQWFMKCQKPISIWLRNERDNILAKDDSPLGSSKKSSSTDMETQPIAALQALQSMTSEEKIKWNHAGKALSSELDAPTTQCRHRAVYVPVAIWFWISGHWSEPYHQLHVTWGLVIFLWSRN